MDVEFKSKKIRKIFENEKKLLVKYGSRRTEFIKRRMYELLAASCLEDLRNLPGVRLHQHTRSKGQKKAVFSVDLDHPYRLLFESAKDPEPTLPGGGVDWESVTEICIIGVENPHHG